MNDDQLLRYSRNIFLPDIGIEGQESYLASSVLIIGLGGLGGLLAMQCAALGVGQLIISDYDQVELHNLNRQLAYDTADIGQEKVSACAARLRAINTDMNVDIVEVGDKLDFAGLERLLQESSPDVPAIDIVVDCSDNFETRYTVNKFCSERRLPLLSAAVSGFDGQLMLFTDASRAVTGCVTCLFGSDIPENVNCSTTGVLGATASWVASAAGIVLARFLATSETKAETREAGHLLQMDARTLSTRSIQLRRDPDCSVCGSIGGSIYGSRG